VKCGRQLFHKGETFIAACTGEKNLRQKYTFCMYSNEPDYFRAPNWRKTSACAGWWCLRAGEWCTVGLLSFRDLLLLNGIVPSEAATFLSVFSTHLVFHPLCTLRQLCVFVNLEPSSVKPCRSCSQRLIAGVRQHTSLGANARGGGVAASQLHSEFLPMPCFSGVFTRARKHRQKTHRFERCAADRHFADHQVLM